jgi:hypothetical protein
MNAWLVPEPNECAPFFHGYLARVHESRVREALVHAGQERETWLAQQNAASLSHAYAPGKWTASQVVRHCLDTEAVFRYRLLAFARDPSVEQAGFSENRWAEATARQEDLNILLQDARSARAETLALLDQLALVPGTQQGKSDGKNISLRALAALIAGHDRHHLLVLAERYTPKQSS